MLHQPDRSPAVTTEAGGDGGPGGPAGRGGPGGWRDWARLAVIGVAVVALLVGFGIQFFGIGVGGGGDDHAGHHEGHVGVAVVEAWTAPSPEALAVYLRLDNNGAPDRLVDAESGAAGTVELMGGGELGHGADDGDTEAIDLEVPEGGTELLPGERHLMLTHLTDPDLAEGDTFPLRLTFERTGAVAVTVEVVSWDEVVERT
jgi:periplasmic copper chaperone A